MAGQKGRPVMLRCAHCGGRAIAGLAHLHGLDVPLCPDCTEVVVEVRESKLQGLTAKKPVVRLKGVRRRLRAA